MAPFLSDYEKSEIGDFDTIYFFPIAERRKNRSSSTSVPTVSGLNNYGFDNDLTRIFKILSKKSTLGHVPLPEIKKKIVCLTKEDLNLPGNEIIRKVKDSDYISFSNNGELMGYKEYLQAYSMEKTKKPISCCDYYVHSKYLGDYLRFQVDKSLDFLSNKDFCSFLNINQIMVNKDYFLKNIPELREAFNTKKINFINKENTAIINIPLLRIKKIKSKNYEIMNTAFDFRFLHQLLSIKSQKKFFTVYPFALFFEILKGKFFILDSLIKTLGDKDKIKKLNNLNV